MLNNACYNQYPYSEINKDYSKNTYKNLKKGTRATIILVSKEEFFYYCYAIPESLVPCDGTHRWLLEAVTMGTGRSKTGAGCAVLKIYF